MALAISACSGKNTMEPMDSETSSMVKPMDATMKAEPMMEDAATASKKPKMESMDTTMKAEPMMENDATESMKPKMETMDKTMQ
jgi:hypothetical protein